MKSSRTAIRLPEGCRLRTAEAYELRLYDRLSETEQDLLRDFRDDPGFYGVLKPKASKGSAKAVGQDIALLWYSLQTPGALPHYVSRTLDGKGHDELVELVLSGVLEIEDGARFVSGPAALDLLAPVEREQAAAQAIASLSRRALQRVAALSLQDARHISRRLYGYHGVPCTAAWSRRLGTADRVREFLELDASLQNMLRHHWRPSGAEDAPWWSWSRRASMPADRVDVNRKKQSMFKLYVSPAMDDLPAAFQALVQALPSTRAHAFKVGNNVLGLLRPDKIVLYFEAYDDLSEATSILASALSGMRPHGVPFTSEIALDGLLSWGMDPPWTERLPWQRSQSWRSWVVDSLAQSLAEFAAVAVDGEAWHFASERLRLRGVDTESWTPQPSLWLGTT